MKPAPGTLGKPSRRVGTPQKPKIEEPAVEPEQISTPVRIQASPAMLAEVSLKVVQPASYARTNNSLGQEKARVPRDPNGAPLGADEGIQNTCK